MHDIKIHDVSFSYAGSDKLVLKDINVDVEGGEFVLYSWTIWLWKEYFVAPDCWVGRLYNR